MRRRILDAAKRLFVKEGFENVSMRRIATAIEYSPAAIYRYFRSKREILSVLRDEGFRRFVAGQRERSGSHSDPLERLRQSGRGYLEFARREPDYYHLMFSTDCAEVELDGDLAVNSLLSYRLFRESVQDCLDTGRFGDVDPEAAAFAFWSGVHGLANLINTGRFGVMAQAGNHEELIDRILEFTLRSARAEDTTAERGDAS